ncbi:MAG: formyltetrahydrofolate deformylase [Candidatus Omnitrophica bacterium]|nr:formyltetrahydrofolate deformylase [Candidatus Omnitrophota bacterium]
MNTAILLISCPDRKGITASVTNFVYDNGGNIEHADQHIDSQTNTFFMRIQWSLEEFRISPSDIKDRFQPLAEKFYMDSNLYFDDHTPRVAIFTSKQDHCLYDLLLRHKEGQFKCSIPLVISNHPNSAKTAASFGIKFAQLEKTPANKSETEKKEVALLKNENIELVILARYMQVLTADFLNHFKNQIINIHHSFLPAFAGNNPYAQAYRRGVKIIGATSHYVTAELDQGPIIEQNTVRISHRDSLADLQRKGKDLEKNVLSEAVRLHLERKILVYDNKTVIFD